MFIEFLDISINTSPQITNHYAVSLNITSTTVSYLLFGTLVKEKSNSTITTITWPQVQSCYISIDPIAPMALLQNRGCNKKSVKYIQLISNLSLVFRLNCHVA